MKLVYAGMISAVLATGAFGQTSQTLQLNGNAEYCLVISSKGDCKFENAASCEKELNASPSKDINSSCIIRRDVQ
jgi:hypothetical protein